MAYHPIWMWSKTFAEFEIKSEEENSISIGYCWFVLLWNWQLDKVRSPEVEMGQILLSNIFNENGKVPSDIPSDTKKSTRVVH